MQPAVLNPLTPHIRTRVSPYETLSDIKFAKVLRRAGLRRFQGDAILELLKDESFDPKALSFHSVTQLQEMQRKTSGRSVSFCFFLVSSSFLWAHPLLRPFQKKFKSFHVSNGAEVYQLWTRDVVDLALELFADPQFAGETALGFKLEMRDGMRLFEEFHTGDWFKAAQVSLAHFHL